MWAWMNAELIIPIPAHTHPSPPRFNLKLPNSWSPYLPSFKCTLMGFFTIVVPHCPLVSTFENYSLMPKALSQQPENSLGVSRLILLPRLGDLSRRMELALLK